MNILRITLPNGRKFDIPDNPQNRRYYESKNIGTKAEIKIEAVSTEEIQNRPVVERKKFEQRLEQGNNVVARTMEQQQPQRRPQRGRPAQQKSDE